MDARTQEANSLAEQRQRLVEFGGWDEVVAQGLTDEFDALSPEKFAALPVDDARAQLAEFVYLVGPEPKGVALIEVWRLAHIIGGQVMLSDEEIFKNACADAMEIAAEEREATGLDSLPDDEEGGPESLTADRIRRGLEVEGIPTGRRYRHTESGREGTCDGWVQGANCVLSIQFDGEPVDNSEWVDLTKLEQLPTLSTGLRMKLTWVTGDWLGDDVEIAAFVVPGENWNGFACPYFPKASAEKVMAEQQKLISEGFEVERLEWDGDAIKTSDPAYAPDDGGEGRIEPTSDGLYPIGAFGWCWQEVEGYEVGWTDGINTWLGSFPTAEMKNEFIDRAFAVWAKVHGPEATSFLPAADAREAVNQEPIRFRSVPDFDEETGGFITAATQQGVDR